MVVRVTLEFEEEVVCEAVGGVPAVADCYFLVAAVLSELSS